MARLPLFLFLFLCGAFGASYDWVKDMNSNMVSNRGEVDPVQQAALVAFYYALNGPSWSYCKWNVNSSYTSWCNLVCAGQDVTQINFVFQNNLSGTLPALLTALGKLSSLVILSNQVQGPIPFATLPPSLEFLKLSVVNGGEFVFPCSNFQSLVIMELVNGMFTGTLPSCMSNMSSLTTLVMGQNELSGSLPPFPPNITNFQLYSNRLTGTIPPLPESMDILVLNINQLTGTLPVLPGGISNLQVNTNFLTGPIPNISHAYIQILDFGYNNFVGSIPSIFGPNLQLLFLEYNLLNGTIPPELYYSPVLTDLHIENNRLTGTIPQNISQLTKLQKLTLNSNFLGGTLPAEIGQNTALIYLALNNNNFYGTIPVEWSNLTLLQQLFLFNNELTGTIPENFFSSMSWLYNVGIDNNTFYGNLPLMPNNTVMKVWQLTYNDFSGPLPSQYYQSPALNALALNNNNLTGTIPVQWGSTWQLLTRLYLNNNKLSGTLPSNFGLLSSLETLDISYNNFSGELFQMKNLINLQTLNLANNHLFGNLEMLNLQNTFISTLRFANNQFKCSDIVLKGVIDHLQIIDLSDNPLNCSFSELLANIMDFIPQGTLSDLKTQLTILLLPRTLIYGPLSFQIQRFSGLVWLNVADNFLNGTLDSLCHRNLHIVAQSDPALSILDLSYNNLSGSLDCLTQYNYLSTLWTSGNNFLSPTQTIPAFMTVSNIDLSNALGNFTCPQLVGKTHPIATDIPASYYSYSLCSCNEGYFGRYGQCWECPTQCQCKGEIVEGCYFEWNHDHELSFVKPCKNILGSTPCNPKSEPSLEMICASGYDNSSRYCSVCNSGHFSTGTSCSKCKNSTLAIMSLLVVLVMFLFKTYESLRSSSNSLITSIVWFHLQMIGSLLQLGLAWPTYGIALFVLHTIAAGSTYSIFQLQCFMKRDGIFWYDFNFWWYVASPLLLVLWALLIYLIGIFIFYVKESHLDIQQDMNLSAGSQVFRRIKTIIVPDVTKYTWKPKCLYMATCLFLDLLFVITLTASTNIVPYTENNHKYLVTAVNMLFVENIRYYVSLFILGVIVIGCLALVYILVKHRNIFENFETYLPYEPWWLLMEIIKRFYFGMVQGMVSMSTILFPVLVTWGFIVFIVIEAYAKPHKAKTDTFAEIFSLSILSFSFYLGTFLLLRSEPENIGQEYTWFILIFNLIYLISISVLFIIKKVSTKDEKDNSDLRSSYIVLS